MTILRNFYDECPERVQVLPIGPLDRNCYRTFLDDSLFLQMGMSSQLLGGIFDGADIGYYVYGIDPRNAKGIKILRKSIETNFLNVPKIDLRYSKTRNFLDAWDSNLNTLVPIFSLHLHSKNPKLFSPSKSLKFLKSGLLAYLEPESWNFVPNIFLRALFIALSRRIKLLHRGLRR